jgi:hypothetical protein
MPQHSPQPAALTVSPPDTAVIGRLLRKRIQPRSRSDPAHCRDRAAPTKAHRQALALFAKKHSDQADSRPAAICSRRVRISSR